MAGVGNLPNQAKAGVSMANRLSDRLDAGHCTPSGRLRRVWRIRSVKQCLTHLVP